MKLSKFCNKISLILQALWCAVLYFLIEALCRHSVVEAWDYMTGKPLVFAYNTMFIFTTMLIVYLFHRRCFWRVVVSVFWLFLGIVNCILLMNRVTPFTGPDLHMLTDGIAIMQKYLPFYGVEQERLTKEIARCEGMLNNPNFVNKAPAAKVDAEKEKLAKYKEMKDKVETQLEQLKR